MIGPFPNARVEARGRVIRDVVASEALRGNPWGDPSDRELYVYLPPDYNKTDGRYPVVMLLAGFAGTGEGMLSRGLTDMSIASRIDRLIEGGCPPFIAVLPDCMTTVGGSQYVDSPGIGNYATFLVDEVKPFVDHRFRTTGGWAVAGKSSGGFGALHLAMTFPAAFDAVASIAGDMGFPLPYLEDLPGAVRAIQRAGGLQAFHAGFWKKSRFSADEFKAFNLIAMSCAYSPDPGARPVPARLPVDLQTGQVYWEVLESWKVFDPVERAAGAEAQAALSALNLLHIECGDKDEHLLHLGARRLVAELERAGVAHSYEEFDGGHRGTSWRYDVVLPRLVQASAGRWLFQIP